MSEPPARPKEPNPMHFGLNTAVVELLARASRVKKVADWISNVVCVLGIALMWSAAQAGHFPMRVAVPSALALMAAVTLLDQVPKLRATRNLKRSGADPTQVTAFQQATREHEAQLKDYEKARRDFDEWFGRSQRAFWLSLSP
jgi:hypothetical protein